MQICLANNEYRGLSNEKPKNGSKSMKAWDKIEELCIKIEDSLGVMVVLKK